MKHGISAFLFFAIASGVLAAGRSQSIKLRPTQHEAVVVGHVQYTPLTLAIEVPDVTAATAVFVVRNSAGSVVISTNTTVSGDVYTVTTVAGNWTSDTTGTLAPGDDPAQLWGDLYITGYGNPLPQVDLRVRYAAATGSDGYVTPSEGAWIVNGTTHTDIATVTVGGTVSGTSLTIPAGGDITGVSVSGGLLTGGAASGNAAIALTTATVQTAMSGPLALKQDAATAATDAELSLHTTNAAPHAGKFDAAGSVSAHNGSNTAHSALFDAAKTNATHINGVAVATVTAGAAAGATALQPTGNAAGLTNFPAQVVQTDATNVKFAGQRFVKLGPTQQVILDDAENTWLVVGPSARYLCNTGSYDVASFADVFRVGPNDGTNLAVYATLTNLTAQIATKVPTTRTITINGTSYDLSADRSWTVSGGSGTTDHAALSNLTYAASGHTGFQPTNANLTTLAAGTATPILGTTSTKAAAGTEPVATNHIADTTAAHAASAISATGTYSTVQAALNGFVDPYNQGWRLSGAYTVTNGFTFYKYGFNSESYDPGNQASTVTSSGTLPVGFVMFNFAGSWDAISAAGKYFTFAVYKNGVAAELFSGRSIATSAYDMNGIVTLYNSSATNVFTVYARNGDTANRVLNLTVTAIPMGAH